MIESTILPKRKKEVNNFLSNDITSKDTLLIQNNENLEHTLTNNFKERILNVLGNIDIYENKKCRSCLPDYKFPEIRWDDNTKFENLDSMTDDEIKSKFQLLTKESKQTKKEVCRQCYQTGKRGIAFEIPYFYKGTENWDDKISIKGKDAELGCEGCAWYDFAEWRKHLLKILEL